jgi:hypothetical protein
MRRVFPLGVAAAAVLAAQLRLPPPGGEPPKEPPKPVEKPAEKPLLQYSGKPMVVAYRCTEEDMTWAGLACSEEDPCRFYVELGSIEAVGSKIFLAGNIHSASTTLYSILLSSEDGGKSWREPVDRLRGAGLDRIQFVDFENGWVSGQVLQPLPQDPFLFITSDGGRNWRRKPISNESRMGSILEFRFSSAANGSLIVDRGDSGDAGRYELYETPNGGDTWMLREMTERVPKIPHSPAGDSDWRIRADAATKSFRIEHHAGDRWNSLAAFAVPIGVCAAPERAQPTPPPEPPPVTEEPSPPTPSVKPPPSLRKSPRSARNAFGAVSSR